MSSIIIAVVVAAFAGGVIGWIAGVARGVSAVLLVAVDKVGPTKAREIADSVTAARVRGKVPPAPHCTVETGCMDERDGDRTAPCSYACNRSWREGVQPTVPPRRS